MKYFLKISDFRVELIRQDNSFTQIRLVLALAVIFSHSYPLSLDGTNNSEPMYRYCGITIGALAVNCFMVISGFLISISLVNSQSLLVYFRKRFLRVYPAFLFLSFIQAFIVAPLVSSDSSKVYTVKQLGILIYNFCFLTSYGFPFGELFHCFPNNPIPSEMNASLWTIRYEVWCYILLPLLLLNKFSKPLCITCLCVFYVIIFWDVQIPWSRYLTAFLGAKAEWPRLAFFFLSGAFYFLFGDKIPRSNLIIFSLLTISLVIIFFAGQFFCYLQYFVLPYLVLGFCFFKSPTQIAGQDWSYGVYLYGFLIGQILVYCFSFFLGKPISLFLGTTVISLIFGYLSWNLIEKRFLGKR